MAKYKLFRSTTSYIVDLYITDTTGAPLTGLVFNSTGLTAAYKSKGAAPTAIVLVTATQGTWTSGGFKEVSSTLMPGWYELGIPNAALASGQSVSGTLFGASGMAPCPFEIELDALNYQDSTRGGMTALPNAAAGAVNGLPLGDASGRVLLQPAQAGVTIPAVTTVGSVTGAVGAISGVTFPGNFSAFSIDVSGHVTLTSSEHVAIETDAAIGILASPSNKIATDVNGRVTTTYPLRANTAFPNFTLYMVSSTDHVTPKTGAVVTGQVALNGGAFGNLTNAVSEVGSGVYKVNLAAGDTNGTDVFLRFTASGADPVNIKLVLNP